MQNVISFWHWFLANMPYFLMAEPIIYFVGLVILAYCIKILLSLRKGGF